MIDKQRFKLLGQGTILVVLIFVALFCLKTVFSIFHSDASGVVANHIAFYVVEAVPQTQSIKIGEVAPDGQSYRYSVDVSNFKNGKTSEVDLEYTLEIITTTNIQVTYELYAGTDTTNNIIGTKEVITDTNGMYFFKFTPQVGTFTHDVQKTDRFTFVITFPSTYNDAAYQDLIETIQITVDANQV